MIKAYTRSNKWTSAINLYHSLLGTMGIKPDNYTFTFVLKACTGACDLEEGVMIHQEVVQRGLECDKFIGTGLVDMYCKLGRFEVAHDLFQKLPVKDVVAWNVLIAGASQCSDPSQSLELFHDMQLNGVKPNGVSLLNLFPAVSKLGDIVSCKCIHGYVIRIDLQAELSNGLIDMYSKCGNMGKAGLIFDKVQRRDAVSWGTIMAGYAHNRHFFEVLELFDGIKKENVEMNKVATVSALMAAAEVQDIERGKEIHHYAIQQRIDTDVTVATPIMTMYAKCRELDNAVEVFDGIRKKDLIAWSAIISAFVQSGYPEKALCLFRAMLNENFKPNRVTLISILPACGDLSSITLGKSLHCYIIKGDFSNDIPVDTALVSMYARCGHFDCAIKTFDKMSCKDVVTWNALINGYAQIGEPHQAIQMFHKFQVSGFHPDAGTMVGLVSACALLNDLKQGTSVHALVTKGGFEFDRHVKNALIDMYAKCGSLSSSLCLFGSDSSVKDVISWNTMISGYMQNGDAKEAFNTFQKMLLEEIRPNAVTFVSVLPAIAHMTFLREGMTLHALVIRVGLMSVKEVGNSLIDMYAKCGQVDFCEKAFHEMEDKDRVSWNALLSGFAVHGQGERAVELFKLMQKSKLQVDSVSYISVLSACRHAQLVEEGRRIFCSMKENQVEPKEEHYACLVDLLGRAGLFDEIMILIEQMPMEASAGVWGALLGASRMHSNVEIGELAVNHLLKLEPSNPTHYVTLSSIYAKSGQWTDARETRSKLKDAGLHKIPGCSWIDSGGDLC